MQLVVGKTTDIISKSQIIRRRVFFEEQNIPLELDLDGLDEYSSHALITENGLLIATARLYSPDGKHSILARVAVVKEYRKNGIAPKVINALIAHAKESGYSTIEIHAHEYLKKYYEKFGFEFIQNVEIVGEHQLIEMQLKL
ncbi:GNAT family N-acetyltransferase [Halarcobacter ebronensis]|uniref:GNAT family N-acetyltransferase n=1 Tax=Halarcobacter ebronensis TaxID=1462615 RepID=A0A4Q0YJY0_9BACT|nr:GNAT family N-acetyltransferase [Halarcobacter ebronensis]RXJ69331.1 GNAT family N-acetyltransferase [Halarcobacter ebronensis]